MVSTPTETPQRSRGSKIVIGSDDEKEFLVVEDAIVRLLRVTKKG